ncbi:hypothetical protein TD95_005219 [Thielaviopsis punctulata]|uniref:Tho complex subunit 7/Mft1p n=1 Tax=Thielaviopsis punctulata TaxID=72032 RepID=A0A0F4ZJP5_9PEZI|nr:hypothetical protein TD95_005219 [Thielaviopsis punctulata]
MDTWGVMEDRSEQELHKNRLLNVEERPFKRVTKRLQTLSTLWPTQSTPNKLPHQRCLLQVLKEDLTIDFSIFNASLSRLQFLFDANIKERARYEADKQRILDECQAVRDQNASLRDDLAAARATLLKRKRFDDLADKITNSRLLRPRDDQRISLKKLEEECAELERERQTYAETWRERRDQFNRIMEEGMLLRAQIRDEADEVDRRQGMNEDEEEADTAAVTAVANTPRPVASRASTPQTKGDGDGGTVSAEASFDGRDKERLGSNLRSEVIRSRSVSRVRTPITREEAPKTAADEGEIEEGEDVEMKDAGSKSTPEIPVQNSKDNDS